MKGLMLHQGAQPCTLEQLRVTPTPQPTRTHTPIPHAEMVDTITKFAKVEGLEILDQSYGIQDGKDRATGEVMPAAKMFGLMTVGLPNGQQRSDDYAVTLGLRNAHDKSFPWDMVLGSRVFVCDNLCFSGELTIRKKHTGGIRDAVIPAILQGFARLPEIEAGQALRLERYRGLEMNQSYANDYFVRAMAAGVFAPNQILTVAQEFANPSHEDFEAHNLWSAFNAVTETLKGHERIEKDKATGQEVTRTVGACPVFDLPQRGRALHAVTDWYAREILADKECPEPDAGMVDWLTKSETRALALN